MAEPDERLLQRLLPIFREEARERIASIAASMAALDAASGADRLAFAETIFRDAHSLKSAARSVGRSEIETICQAIEGIFAAAKQDGAALPAAQRRALGDAVELLEDVSAGRDLAPSERQSARAVEVVEALELALDAPAPAAAPEPPLAAAPPRPAPASEPAQDDQAPAAAETVRLSVERLNDLLLNAEEMLAEKVTLRRLAVELAALSDEFELWKREQFRTVAGEAFEMRLAAARRTAAAESHALALKIDRMFGAMRQVLRLPCSWLLQQYPSVVRNLARDQGKDVALDIRGADFEIDRRLLQDLSVPLLHLLRNSVDHGIETPAERRAAGKDARASIVLAVAPREGDKVEFTVIDDGAGIALNKLAAAARTMGIIVPGAAAPAAAELLPLIFQSGLSTRSAVSDLSGRGLGLAIVREKIERLGGSIAVESTPGQGTIFRIVLPLSLAIYRGIAVRAGGGRFLLPTFRTDRVARVRRSAISTDGGSRTVAIAGDVLPAFWLGDVLELQAPGRRESEWALLVLLGDGARRVALEADDIEGDQEILLKPLGGCLQRVRNIQGGAILPDGSIALVLNVEDVLKSAANLAGTAVARPAVAPDAVAVRSVLVAEDSVTARELLKATLEAAGYRVLTAIDGMDAWATLQREPVDMLVSDIEMPRMSGIELTARIRRDKGRAALPIVLVTALAAREDVARGLGAGADAYLRKDEFEPGQLVETVARLMR